MYPNTQCDSSAVHMMKEARTVKQKPEIETGRPVSVMHIAFLIKHMTACWHVWLYRCVFVYAVSSGSVTVNADSSVQLLAEEAVPLDQLDIAVSTMSTLQHSHTNMRLMWKVCPCNTVFYDPVHSNLSLCGQLQKVTNQCAELNC